MGVGYDTVVATNPFTDGAGAPEANFRIARMMARMWISFIVDLDPNNSGGEFSIYLLLTAVFSRKKECWLMNVGVIASCVDWPKYTVDNEVNFMIDANVTELAYTAADDFRVAEIGYIMKNVINA